MAEHRHYGKAHPDWVDFPNNLPLGTRIDGMSRERKPITEDPGLSIEEVQVKARDKWPILVRAYRSAKSKDTRLPLFIYLHGGGYVTGSLETDDASCRALALTLPLCVLGVEYRLAPEHKFPTGFGDASDVLKWAATESAQEKLRLDLSLGFILGGTSAGANFTAGLSHLAVLEGLTPPLTGLVFLAPSFCHPDARPDEFKDRILSVDEIDDAPGLTRTQINGFAELYGASPTDKRLSPLLFDDHRHLAKKAFFAICGWDPRRDEGLLFEQILQESGLKTKLHVYAGLPHGFWTTCPGLPVSRQWEHDLIEGVRWILEDP